MPVDSDRRLEHAVAKPIAERTTSAGVSGSVVKWLGTDVQNSATLEVDRVSGVVTRRYVDPFGNTRGTAAAWSSSHGFLNKAVDAFTGLDMVGARQYDPGLGRFTSVDAVLAPSSPQQNNGYSYAQNNPVTLSDPAGTDPAPATDCITLQCRNASYGSIAPAAAGNNASAKKHAKAAQSCAYNDWYCNRASSAPGQGSAAKAQDSAMNRDIQLLEEREMEVEPWKRSLYPFVLWQQEFAIKARPLVILAAIAGAGSGASVPTESAGTTSVAIGRNMTDRVIPYAESNGYGWYNGTPSWVPRSSIERMSPRALEATDLWFNKRWIDKQINSGTKIFDVGEPHGYQPSRFYNMELQQVSGYSNYFRDFQP